MTTDRKTRCRDRVKTEHAKRLMMWSELLVDLRHFEARVNEAKAAGALDAMDAQSILECTGCIEGELVSAVPTE